MKAKIKLWGNEYNVLSVNWGYEGIIDHVCFRDENNVLYVIHNEYLGADNNAEENRYSEEPIYANLKEVIEWEV